MQDFDQMRRIFRQRLMQSAPVTITVEPAWCPSSPNVEYKGLIWSWSAFERPDGYVDVVLDHPRERSDYDWPAQA